MPRWPSQLTDARDEAESEIVQLETITLVLEELQSRFEAASTPQEQNVIMEQYLQLERDGQLPSTIAGTELEYFIEFDLRNDIADLDADLARAESNCNSS